MKINPKPKFNNYKSKEDYINANVRKIEPMTAKEFLNEEELELMLTSTDYYAEEKLDGTRATMHISKEHSRIFSRRISNKTDWYAENSDSVPHLRDICSTEFNDTVIDGEMRIAYREFSDVSGLLNCNYDKAIERQKEIGFVTFHAFDIIYYKGVYVAKMPLEGRKELLSRVIKTLDEPYLVLEPYTDFIIKKPITRVFKDALLSDEELFKNKYANLYSSIYFFYGSEDFWNKKYVELDKKAWYDYILLHGGEGLMLKPKKGIYRHTRGREYTKLKKFDTWDCVILDYVPPTEEYTGKELKTWKYWGVYRQGNLEEIVEGDEPDRPTQDHSVEPVTKHFAKDWIGTVKFGVKVEREDLAKWKKKNPKLTPELYTFANQQYLVVGETSGFDEETRAKISENKDFYLYSVIEVKAQEVLGTGKLRHPRFLRFRSDKTRTMCDYSSHMRLTE